MGCCFSNPVEPVAPNVTIYAVRTAPAAPVAAPLTVPTAPLQQPMYPTFAPPASAPFVQFVPVEYGQQVYQMPPHLPLRSAPLEFYPPPNIRANNI